jgi:hypothetical protein
MALFFAKRNRLHVPGITLSSAVSVVEAAVRALKPYDQRKKNWSDQLIRWNRKHGLPRSRKRRPTIVDSWLATFGLTSGDVISVPRANLLRTQLNVSWRRYHTREATSNQMLWRHRPLAEVALMMIWRDDRTVEVKTVRVIHRKPRRGAGLCHELCQSAPMLSQSVPCSRKTSKRPRKRQQARITYEKTQKSQGYPRKE